MDQQQRDAIDAARVFQVNLSYVADAYRRRYLSAFTFDQAGSFEIHLAQVFPAQDRIVAVGRLPKNLAALFMRLSEGGVSTFDGENLATYWE